MQKKETLGELIRFGIVGTTSAAIHYAIYWILQHWIEVNVAYTRLRRRHRRRTDWASAERIW